MVATIGAQGNQAVVGVAATQQGAQGEIVPPLHEVKGP